jgi:hypothetical protein
VRVKSPTERPETYSPRLWDSPEAQQMFGRALVKTGQKHKDRGMIRLGRMHQATAASASSASATTPAPAREGRGVVTAASGEVSMPSTGGSAESEQSAGAVVMSDESIHTIIAALPSTCPAARLVLLPDILRDWSAVELRIHLLFLPDRQKAARKQLAKLETLGRQAARLLDGLKAIDAGTMATAMLLIERRLTDGSGAADVSHRLVAAGRRRLVEEWLTSLAAEFAGQSRVAKKGPPTSPAPLVLFDLAAIFEWITGIPASRRVCGEDDEKYGQDYGPFWNFARAAWTPIFGPDAPLSDAMRRWAEWRNKDAGTLEYSSVIANIAERHPEWCLFGS